MSVIPTWITVVWWCTCAICSDMPSASRLFLWISWTSTTISSARSIPTPCSSPTPSPMSILQDWKRSSWKRVFVSRMLNCVDGKLSSNIIKLDINKDDYSENEEEEDVQRLPMEETTNEEEMNEVRVTQKKKVTPEQPNESEIAYDKTFLELMNVCFSHQHQKCRANRPHKQERSIIGVRCQTSSIRTFKSRRTFSCCWEIRIRCLRL